MLKSTLLLATALFLITAPSPDAADLSEATHGLVADTGAAALHAAERTDGCAPGTATAQPPAHAADDACPAALATP